tara:strand:+ start:296 stop:811 length:516 start_codon:yes stop_codon:yes gene_type:complete
MKKTFLFLLSYCMVSVSFAASVPNTITVRDVSMQLVGEATLGYVLFDVYNGYLWAEAGEYSADKPHALELHYLMSFDKESLAERSIAEIRENQQADEAQFAHWQTELERVFRDVEDGDTIRATYMPKEGVIFSYNGEETGVVEGRDFATHFMGIWLAETTSEPEFRAALLD